MNITTTFFSFLWPKVVFLPDVHMVYTENLVLFQLPYDLRAKGSAHRHSLFVCSIPRA